MIQQQIIGRKSEIERLNKYVNSSQPEFIAIYGRRRVGKTFLVNHVFQSRFAFSMTGVIGGGRDVQLEAFVDAMDLYAGDNRKPANWHEAFRMLRRYLMMRLKEGQPCIVFIDELPCFDTHKSGFTEAFSLFWNGWAAGQAMMKLIVCGSATSWMMSNIIDSHGGLHNRITHEIHLREFTLREAEEFLHSLGLKWRRNLVLQCYMAMGGVPYYLNLLDPSLSLSQNMDHLFFSRSGELYREFHRLYNTLFSNSEPYIAVIEKLFSKKVGMTRNEIAMALKVNANGRLTQVLRNLVDSDIVRFYSTKTRKLTARNGIYQLTDFFSLFYLQFMRNEVNDEQWWSKNIYTPRINSWRGLAFERVCIAHIAQIKHALGIDAITTTYYSWRSVLDSANAQIDIIIDRADMLTHVCEVKYSDHEYAIDREEYNKFTRRIAAFVQQTGTKNGIIPTFITSSGLATNSYAEQLAVKEITLDDLFAF